MGPLGPPSGLEFKGEWLILAQSKQEFAFLVRIRGDGFLFFRGILYAHQNAAWRFVSGCKQ